MWSRKSHSAVTAIAVAGVCGVAIATMAIVCVLSVFNGFNEAIIDRDARIMPDITVTPTSGSIIANADSLARAAAKVAGVQTATPVVNDEAVAFSNGRQLPVKILGVKPADYRLTTAIDSIIVSGQWKPQPQEIVDLAVETEMTAAQSEEITELAEEEFDENALFAAESLTDEPQQTDSLPVASILISSGVAANLKLPSTADSGLMIFLPRRTGSASYTDPASSFMVDSLVATGIFASQQGEFDAATVIMDIDVARRLLEYDTQANQLYVKVKNGASKAATINALKQALGNDYTVSSRSDRQTLHFRMVAIEKWITFLLLSFILLIASFNIISTLSMLIVEKRSNIRTMTDYGATRGFIGRVFFFESIVVCLSGSLSGLTLGVILCLLQQHFGLISIPGDPSQIIMSSYPVSIRLSDLLVILALSVAVAFATGLISAAFARRTSRQKF
ncbi:MAG: FtsX-like permease family protein [Ruminococcus sp.]|nr:FtsX-like permease family protein [Ruminococcus sp.]